jgi:isoleucyl-tRNA synthetase
MYLICDGLARLLAPILPFTADEIWRHLPGARSASVHLEDFPAVDRFLDSELLGTWERLLAVREQVTAALEEQRREKVIGTSLGAKVVVTAAGPIVTVLDRYRDLLPTLFIVSDVGLHLGAAEGQDQVSVTVEKAPGVKCARCWRVVSAIRTEPEWAGICDRCVEALAEPEEAA